jgi:hypothetical protein
MNRWTLVLVALLVGMSVGYADAAVVFSDNFDSENGGVGTLNYTGFAQWTVTLGTVDLIGNGYYDFPPVTDGHGLYVDMDGSSSQAGTMVSLNLPLGPGSYVLSYELAGNQRGGPDDTVTASVEVGVSPAHVITLASSDPFATFSDNFTLTTAQTVNIQFAASGGDNIGILLDNVKLESVVPEPTTIVVWGLLGGLGLAVGYFRRKRSA